MTEDWGSVSGVESEKLKIGQLGAFSEEAVYVISFKNEIADS